MKTHRLQFRRLSSEDSRSLFRTFGDPDVMRYWIGGPDKNISETEKRIHEINKHWQKHSFGDWGIAKQEDSELIGFGGLHYVSDIEEVNIGYAFEKRYWRNGYGIEACRAILDFGFSTLNLEQIVAVIWPLNIASISLVEKCGLKFWKDIDWKGGERVVYKADKII